MDRVDPGRKWGSDDRLEVYVRDRLVNYPDFFRNHEDIPLPLMDATIPGQFNNAGHGIDIMAFDGQRRLWIIEVSRGSRLGAGLVKELKTRVKGGAQMSPAWRRLKQDEFMKLSNSHEKLAALFDTHGLSQDEMKSLFAEKLDKSKVAIVVPAGCHVEGLDTGISFGREIYTFFVSPEIRLHCQRRKT